MFQLKARHISISIILIISFFVAALCYDWLQFYYRPLISSPTPVLYDFKPGMTVNQFANDLAARNLINRPRYLVFLAHFLRLSNKFKVGEYSLLTTSTPREVLEQIVEGKVFYRSFTIVEGWTFNQIKEALRRNNYLSHDLQNLSQQEIAKILNLPKQSVEGQFFPETYRFTKGTSEIKLLRQAHALMEKTLTKLWQSRSTSLPLTDPYQVLIMASIIEKETAVAEERPLMAGVVFNRLKKHMRLQLDPTVIYGLGENYNGKLTKEDLLTDTAYNSYLHKGLPPTPICMPGEVSMRAVVQPAVTNYLYFVAKGEGDGRHEFSVTLQQQNEAVNRYIRGRKP